MLYARRQDGARLGWRCRRNGEAGLFSVADAQELPYQDGSFDVVASALVINFVQDREQALRETRRVARAGRFVVGYVWELEAEFSPSWPLRCRTVSLKVAARRQAPSLASAEG